jgi:hypothetical protein
MTHANFHLPSLALTLFVLITAGCGTGIKTTSSAVAGSALQGRTFGGQQPIAGATMQLYAAGSTSYGIGYNAGASSLIPAGSYFAGGAPGCVASSLQTCYPNIVTDTSGSFTITGDYTCPSASTQVYLTATGGNPGLPGNGNPNIALMAALGPCGNLGSSTSVVINELTTVASVWALSPFMSAISAVGTTAGNTTGLANAFASVNKLVNVGAGSLPGPALPPGAALPVTKMNLLANILANCVNSSGGVANDTSTPCGALFNAATVNGVSPTDTLTAALNLAQNQGTSLAAVSRMVPPSAPFQPALPSAPSDLGLIITYSGGALSSPKGIAADASGNIWVPNAGNGTVSKLDALGVTTTDAAGFLSGSAGFTAGSLNAPSGIALDNSGNAWIANSGNGTVTKLSSDGTSATVYTGGGLSTPYGLAIDAGGNAWVANFGNSSVTQITVTGTLTNFNGTAIVSPSAVAINPK